MQTKLFKEIILGSKSTVKISDPETLQELYFRMYFHGGMNLTVHSESFTNAFLEATPHDLVDFIVTNLKLIVTNPLLTGYTKDEQRQLLSVDYDTMRGVLMGVFEPIWKNDIMVQSDWADINEMKSNIMQRIYAFEDDDSKSAMLFETGIDETVVPPAIYDAMFWYMGDEIDKAKKFKSEVDYEIFVGDKVRGIFSDTVDGIDDIVTYLIRDLHLNYPSKNIPSKIMVDATDEDIKANTMKVPDEFLDADLQQVIQQQKIRQQNQDQPDIEIPEKTYLRKNGVCKLIFSGGFCIGEFYPVDLNPGKRVAGKYVTLPFKSTKNAIAQFSAKKIAEVKDGKSKAYVYGTPVLNDFIETVTLLFDKIAQPRKMWEVK